MEDKRLEKARKEYETYKSVNDVFHCEALERIFPELAESEDEKIRKLLIRKITQERGSLSNDEATKCIAYLEKQGEQKPTDVEEPDFFDDFRRTDSEIEPNSAAWSEGDEYWLSGIIKELDEKRSIGVLGKTLFDGMTNWLKSIKNRMQSKQEYDGTEIAPPIDSDVCG